MADTTQTTTNTQTSTTIKINEPKITKFNGEVIMLTDMEDYYRVEVEELDGTSHIVNIPLAFHKKAKLANWLKLDSAVTVSTSTRIKGVTTYINSAGEVILHGTNMTKETSVVFSGISRISARKWRGLQDDVQRADVEDLVKDFGAEKALTIEQILAMRR